MRVSQYPDVDPPSAGPRPVVTLGNFDGVHLGHQRAFEILVARARALGTSAVALTFEPHPMSVLRPERAPKRILTPRLKEELIAAHSVDHLVVVPFTREFSELSAEDFVGRVLVSKLRAAELVLGSNFRFGHGRKGDVAFLRRAGESHGFVVHEVESIEYGGEVVSSSRIRRTLEEGDVSEAGAMLGRPYFVAGRVVRGAGRGRLMGFPTANVEVEGDVLVGDGVYVTEAVLEKHSYPGMTHVGGRPTFGLEDRTVETHLFEFDREIYGAPLRLHFHHRIRGTVRFSSKEALEQQLRRDREEALRWHQELRAGRRNLVL